MDEWMEVRDELLELIAVGLTTRGGQLTHRRRIDEADAILSMYDELFNERWVPRDAFITREHP